MDVVVMLLADAAMLGGGACLGYSVGLKRTVPTTVGTVAGCKHSTVRFDTYTEWNEHLDYKGYCTQCGSAFSERLPINKWNSKEHGKKWRKQRILLAMEARGWIRDTTNTDDEVSGWDKTGEVYFR